jgi:hypothetical protein
VIRKISLGLSWVVIAVGFMLASERQAHAYADPGSSLLILQAAGAAFTATGLYFRRRIAALFKRKPSIQIDSSSASGAPSVE